jgi:hypothetical protein
VVAPTCFGITLPSSGNFDSIRLTHHVTRHITPIHNILSTAQLSISQKALGTFPERVVSSVVGRENHHVTIHNMPTHNVLSTAPQLSISQKALGTLPEDNNIIPKHVGATIHN